MICCSFIAALFALPVTIILFFMKKSKDAPLQWQLLNEADPAEKYWFKTRLQSFQYAFTGLKTVLKTEPNARLHLLAATLVIIMGLFFQIEQGDWIALTLTVAIVWFAETINTAFEYLCDVVSPEKREAVKHAKDIAAGAVLITAIAAVVVGFLVFVPYFR